MAIKKNVPLLDEYLTTKDEHKEQYQRKKDTQKQAKERRKFIRQLKEDRDYS
jgi:hypothetical protein